ncbi:hypothetical protein SUGI_0974890 [Cryptomeria japonica]|nr:hypothetical protein SUGI_0974890 [Cryptomeria japonica]
MNGIRVVFLEKNFRLGKCFKCQQLGHWAKDCPNNSTQEQVPNVLLGNGSLGKCFKCQQLGHWAKHCPSNSTQEQIPSFSLGNDVIPPKMCRCDRESLIITSNAFTNPGRKFYRCYQCEFFEWCPDLEAFASQNPNPNSQSRNPNPSLSSSSDYHSPNPSQSSPPNNPNSPTQNPNASAHEELGLQQQFASPGCDGRIKYSNESSILCECEAGPCMPLTTQNGKNKGQQYFKCPIKKGEGSCGFFKWCDELVSATSSSNNSVKSEPEETVRRNGA